MSGHRVMQRSLALAGSSCVALALTGTAPARVARPAVSKVTVTFTDKSIRVSPTTPSSGMTMFVVYNKGNKDHLLMVKGPGIKAAKTAKLRAGASAKLTVTLRPGAYVLSD